MIARALVVLCAFSGVACEAILDIEDATVDPAPGPSHFGGSLPSSGGGGAGGTPGEGGGEAPDLCALYCDTVMESCTGLAAVYTTLESCLAVCEHLPPGQPGDESNNSVHCRLRHAETAPAEPTFYCPIAGPGGQGVCGDNCQGLCALAQGVCSGDIAEWPTSSACQKSCADLPDLGTYSTDPSFAMYEGDHVQCRLFHASSAANADPEAHCPHLAGAPPCVAPAR